MDRNIAGEETSNLIEVFFPGICRLNERLLQLILRDDRTLRVRHLTHKQAKNNNCDNRSLHEKSPLCVNPTDKTQRVRKTCCKSKAIKVGARCHRPSFSGRGGAKRG